MRVPFTLFVQNSIMQKDQSTDGSTAAAETMGVFDEEALDIADYLKEEGAADVPHGPGAHGTWANLTASSARPSMAPATPPMAS